MQPDTETVWLVAARFVRLLVEQGNEELIPLLIRAAVMETPDGRWLYEKQWEELKASWKAVEQ